MKKIKIGIIGCGTIGSEIALAVASRFNKKAALSGICDFDAAKSDRLKKALKGRIQALSMDALIKSSDIVIEAATAKASLEIAKKSIRAKKDVMIMSVGGIIKDYAALFISAEKSGCRIYLPSGAICGLDGIKAAGIGKIARVQLTTRKNPKGFLGAPYIQKKGIDLNAIKSETVLFEGNALEAIDGFPANINVACTLSIAGIGPRDTIVKIITSPEYQKNIHEVTVEGEFGVLFTRTQNVPAPNNPKTSYLAVLSAIATLKQILESAKVGT